MSNEPQNVAFIGHVPSMTIGPSKPVEPAEVVMFPGDKWDKGVMRVNTDDTTVRDHIRQNMLRQLPQLGVYSTQPVTICIIGGGWSLNDPKVYKELQKLYMDGAKIVALNGSAKWCTEHNFRVSLHIILDARECNVAFVEEEIEGCRYLIASQCHPSLFDALEDRDVHMFHLANSESEDPIYDELDEYYVGRWTKVPSAGTVGIVAPLVCRALGFQDQHLFGLDSCLAPSDNSHHAYAQSWNDGETHADFESNGRVFRCTAWMASQAQTFIEMLSEYGAENNIKMTVHGDGLIAHMIECALQSETETLSS